MEGNEPRFQCAKCSGFWKNRKRFIQHVKSCDRHLLPCDRAKMKAFQCSQCLESFRTRSGRRYHETKKHPLILEECQHCQKTFASKVSLAKHMRTHAPPPAVCKVFKCSFCQQSFTTYRTRSLHCKEAHPEDVKLKNEASKSKKKFNCFHCGKIFVSLWYCRKHEELCSAKRRSSSNESSTDTNLVVTRASTTHYNDVDGSTSEGNAASKITPLTTSSCTIIDSVTPSTSNCNDVEVQDSTSDNAAFGESLSPMFSPAAANLIVTPTQSRHDIEIQDSTSDNAASEESLLPTSSPAVMNSVVTPTSNRHDIEIQDSTSACNTACNETPSLTKYLRDRKPFMKLGTPDVQTPRRSLANLRLGQSTVKKYQRKVDTLQQTIRRLRKKLVTMEAVIAHLEEKNYISSSAADTLSNSLPQSFLRLAMRGDEPSRSKYDQEIRKFALTLNFYSAKAYKFVWSIWKRLLPAPSTLRTWYSQVNGDPGFSKEAFNALKTKASDSQVICNLVWDEVDIRSQLTYKNDQYHGYVELGFGQPTDNDAQPLAKKAMVFMLVCLNGRWKLPVAYFLVDSMTGKQLAQLVTTALEMVDDVGVIVRSLTFDGIAVNQTCCKELGANLKDGPEFRPWFYHPCHPEQRVFLFPDACHNLKLVRNTMGDYTLTDSEERSITMYDVKELYYLGVEEGLTSIPRITKRHIKWRENKMRVKLAAQVLSNSMYAGLLHAKQKNLAKFEKCEGTAEYCRQFDGIFDLLNCRSRFGRKSKPYLVPVEASNMNMVSEWCQSFENYIRGLRIGETPILEHARMTGFRNFIICLQNLVPLFQCLHEYGLKYLLTYKLSQDHLEVWFSSVRAKGGNNNNPNAEQFKAIFKRLLVHHEIRTSESANCAGNSIAILEVTCPSSANPAVNVQVSDEILSTVCVEEMFDDPQEEIVLTPTQRDIVSYLAGFVVKKLQDKKMQIVAEHLNTLKDSENTSDLIKLKNRGGLVIPSSMIEEVCREVEVQSRIHESSLVLPHKIASVEAEILEVLDESGKFEGWDAHILELITKIYLRIKIRYQCRQISEVSKNIRHSSTKRVTQNHQ